MMKKILSLMAIFVAASNAFAGGLLTNTNQNAAFVRNFAQEGKIDLTSIYANPAGGAFLANGWHLSLNSQTAFQRREVETTFPLFRMNTDNPNVTHDFLGKATAPIIPSLTASYNRGASLPTLPSAAVAASVSSTRDWVPSRLPMQACSINWLQPFCPQEYNTKATRSIAS